MVSGFLDFFSGRSASSEKKAQLFKQHIVPIVHRKFGLISILTISLVHILSKIVSCSHADDRSRLSFEVCTHWIGKRVIFQLIKFERPQLGVIKYIGCDTQGLLCAGVEFVSSNCFYCFGSFELKFYFQQFQIFFRNMTSEECLEKLAVRSYSSVKPAMGYLCLLSTYSF